MDLKNFTIFEDKTIEEAMVLIAKNKYGMVLVSDRFGKIVGTATDGDIREVLLKNGSLKQQISLCMERNFVFVTETFSREKILKLFVNGVNVIPVLSNESKLIDIVARDSLLPPNPKKTISFSRAPVRVSFGGGGSDVTNFFEDSPGAVLNTTINRFAYASLKVRNDPSIKIYSYDYDTTLSFDRFSDFKFNQSNLPLVHSVLSLIKPNHGFELFLQSDFPSSSGLGGSSAIVASILGCFNELREDKWQRYELAELAYQAERVVMNSAGGWQDQYATVFGGLNLMEFNFEKNIVIPIHLSKKDVAILESNLILVDTGIKHNSSNIHIEQRIKMENEKSIKKKVVENVKLSYSIRDSILRGNFELVGKLLNEAWDAKKKFARSVTNKDIDNIYANALENGATGGKLLGAGGGGFFLFYVPQIQKINFLKFLKSEKLEFWQIHFDNQGLVSWSE